MRVNLSKTLFILPNLFTLSSIFCGFYATILCAGDPQPDAFHRAALLIMFAGFFDTIDGRVARLTKTQSAFGVQIDSLADVGSFGVAPAVLVYQWSLKSLGTIGLVAAFAFLACGAIRLARFNVLAMGKAGAPKKPGKYILGLPIPGAAGFIVSLVVANYAVGGELERSAHAILAVVGALSFFMVSTIKFRSFKDLKLNRPTVLTVAFTVSLCTLVGLQFHVSFVLVCLLSTYAALAVGETLFLWTRRDRAMLAAVDEDQATEREAS
jgi:CDP-diacylglycerol--serine O-phosphatidyltransferase